MQSNSDFFVTKGATKDHSGPSDLLAPLASLCIHGQVQLTRIESLRSKAAASLMAAAEARRS